jgi:hypothetical protein
MLYIIIFGIFTALFSKEYLLVNDNLIIILVFAIIFIYIISVASPIVENHINDVRLNMINEFAVNVKGNVSLVVTHFNTLKRFLEYLYFVDEYLASHYDLLVTSEEIYS